MVTRQKLLDALRACVEAADTSTPGGHREAREDAVTEAAEKARRLLQQDAVEMARDCKCATSQMEKTGDLVGDLLATHRGMKAPPPIYHVINALATTSMLALPLLWFDLGEAVQNLKNTAEGNGIMAWEEWTLPVEGSLPELELALHATQLLEEHPIDDPWWQTCLCASKDMDFPDDVYETLREMQVEAVNCAVEQFIKERSANP